MGKRVVLPIAEPAFCTYQSQAAGGVIQVDNPSLRNWYLNECVMLKCSKTFLDGYSSPLLQLVGSGHWEIPHMEKATVRYSHIGKYVNYAIRNFIDKGYYVIFTGADDFYIKGKCWYKERHFNHDGLIIGYDTNKGTYILCGYDSSWIYRVFETPVKCIDRARKEEQKKGFDGLLCGLKAKPDIIKLEPYTILNKLKEYLASSIDKYPRYIGGEVFGIAVHDYLAMYIGKLEDESILHKWMDRRVFRLVWEHKKMMLDRLQAVEVYLKLDSQSSEQYKEIVKESESIHALYAIYKMRKRKRVLPMIREKILVMAREERDVLTEFVKKMEGVMCK